MIPTRPITYEDSLHLPENRFAEIVDGESRIMPPPAVRHRLLIDKLARLLRAQLNEAAYVVLTFGYGRGIRRGPVLTYRVPDLMVLRREALDRVAAEQSRDDPYLWAAPELIVECLSPANRKGSVEKLIEDYTRIGVPEIWLLDPQRRERTRQGNAALPGVVDLNELWNTFDTGRL